ncbi:MAG: inositol monophosphatase family protein [Smithellaceae bacterium]|nr:inositol monophosphatase family protein [Smithellaceae bacterium]
MKGYEKLAVAVAREAGALLRKRFTEKHTVEYKGEINIVTEADRLAEDLIIGRISAEFPDHDILAEESAATDRGASYRWIIDPLDGTTNYAHGYPVFCVSIALEREGEIVLGVVHNPMLKEMFVAVRGGGARLNGQRISVSKTNRLARSLLATGFPYDIRESSDNNIDYFTLMALSAQAIRRAGSAALDMSYVACGRFDGFWELKLMPWDTAAGWLLIEEAGGSVTDIHGRPFRLRSPHALASNALIHGQMIETLKRADRSRTPT